MRTAWDRLESAFLGALFSAIEQLPPGVCDVNSIHLAPKQGGLEQALEAKIPRSYPGGTKLGPRIRAVHACFLLLLPSSNNSCTSSIERTCRSLRPSTLVSTYSWRARMNVPPHTHDTLPPSSIPAASASFLHHPLPSLRRLSAEQCCS